MSFRRIALVALVTFVAIFIVCSLLSAASSLIASPVNLSSKSEGFENPPLRGSGRTISVRDGSVKVRASTNAGKARKNVPATGNASQNSRIDTTSMDSGTAIEMKAKTGIKTKTNAETNAETNDETNEETNVETNAETNAETETETEMGTETGTETETETETELDNEPLFGERRKAREVARRAMNASTAVETEEALIAAQLEEQEFDVGYVRNQVAERRKQMQRAQCARAKSGSMIPDPDDEPPLGFVYMPPRQWGSGYEYAQQQPSTTTIVQPVYSSSKTADLYEYTGIGSIMPHFEHRIIPKRACVDMAIAEKYAKRVANNDNNGNHFL